MKKKIFIKTFGCQMNEYDSNRIFDSVKKIGFDKTERYEDANCYLLNTCHIRDKAKEKVYHEIGRVKKIFRSKITYLVSEKTFRVLMLSKSVEGLSLNSLPSILDTLKGSLKLILKVSRVFLNKRSTKPELEPNKKIILISSNFTFSLLK